MFNYDQNAQLTHIRQQERLNEGERNRLADDGKPRTNLFGAAITYALRKLDALEQTLKTQPQAEVTATSTQEMAAVR
jgi:hypothetical protein